MSQIHLNYIADYVFCPRCGSGNFVQEGVDNERVSLDPLTGKSMTTVYRKTLCIDCNYKGEYVPWRETSQGNSPFHVPLPLTQPPAISNAALILDAQRLVLASESSCGAAVFRAQLFEHAEYIVWCTGTVLKRVRTAQRELVVADTRESYRYYHVWDGVEWNQFWFQSGWIEDAATTNLERIK